MNTPGLAQAAEITPTPNLAVFLVAAISGLVVLLLTLWLGRAIESGGGRLFVFLVGLILATAMALLVLNLFGVFDGIGLDVVEKIG